MHMKGGLSESEGIFTREELVKHLMRSGFDEKSAVAQIDAGIKVEREHINDPNIQFQIAKDHLTEHPKYYIFLAIIEEQMKIDEKAGEEKCHLCCGLEKK